MRTNIIIKFDNNYYDDIEASDVEHIPKVGEFVRRGMYDHEILRVSHEFENRHYVIVTCSSVQRKT